LSRDIECGFVNPSDCQQIVSLKIKLILLGVAAQSLEELEQLSLEYNSGNVQLSKHQWEQWTQLEQNLSYLVDMIEPMVLMLNLFGPIEKPLTHQKVMVAYYQTAEELSPLENYTIPTYNSEPKLSKSGVEWNTVEGKWKKVQAVVEAEEELEQLEEAEEELEQLED
jgi:hypothetical protein